MIWKGKQDKVYPDIILSDCLIVGITVKGEKILIDFSELGFAVKDEKSGSYYHTNGAQIVMEECELDDLSITEIRTQQLSDELYFDSVYNLENKDFLNNINSGKWEFEIVEEYYSVNGGLYLGKVWEKEESFWCCVKIRFKELKYLWNDLNYEFPFD